MRGPWHPDRTPLAGHHELAAGAGDKLPKKPTLKTSMALDLALVVTSSLEPSGE